MTNETRRVRQLSPQRWDLLSEQRVSYEFERRHYNF